MAPALNHSGVCHLANAAVELKSTEEGNTDGWAHELAHVLLLPRTQDGNGEVFENLCINTVLDKQMPLGTAGACLILPPLNYS